MLSIIVAVTRNGIIGRDGSMPWHLPDELRYFKKITWGKPIVMGRKTHQSIGKALPGRDNIVITTNPEFDAPGCQVVNSFEQALAATADADEVMIIGGSSLFEEAMPRAERLYLTLIDADLDGDVRFPDWQPDDWQLVQSEQHPADNLHDYPFEMHIWQRRKGD